MISHKHECIFIHIPKCAGTSVESALGHLDNWTGRDGQDHRSLRMIEPFLTVAAFNSIENVREIYRRQRHRYFVEALNPRNKYLVTKREYNSYFKFTIVRNPWDRALSWYRNVMRDDVHLEMLGITNDITFKDFLTDFSGKGMLSPQLYWIKGFDGCIPLDYIARFENLSNEVEFIFSQIKTKKTNFPHEIRSERVDYRKYYDEETHNLILRKYKEDINAFGYKFDPNFE